MKIKIISNDSYKMPLSKTNSSFFSGILNGYHLPREKIREFISDADVLMLASESVMPFDKELIDACKNTKLISLDTTDYSWIDVKYAAKKGIIVANCPHVSTEAVAEHTFAMMLNFAKNIHFAYQDLYLHDGQMKSHLGCELNDKTLGIIGLGSIGLRMAEIAKGFGMNVIAWNRTNKKEQLVKMVDLKTLLKESDFITLHITACKETLNFLDKDKISLIKPTAFVFNLADKTLVNNDDMYKALLAKKIAGYCVELWEIKETREHPIFELENVIAFNGFGWYTKESLERTFNTSLSNIQNYLKGKIINKVN